MFRSEKNAGAGTAYQTANMILPVIVKIAVWHISTSMMNEDERKRWWMTTHKTRRATRHVLIIYFCYRFSARIWIYRRKMHSSLRIQ